MKKGPSFPFFIFYTIFRIEQQFFFFTLPKMIDRYHGVTDFERLFTSLLKGKGFRTDNDNELELTL